MYCGVVYGYIYTIMIVLYSLIYFESIWRTTRIRTWTEFISFLFILLTLAQNLVIRVTSGEVCFGRRVVLLCIHPDPLADPDNYLGIPITWAENGTVIDLSDPVHARLTPTRVNSTASILSFDITEEDHRDRVILYTCFLVRNDANRDRVESNPLMVDPPGEWTLWCY